MPVSPVNADGAGPPPPARAGPRACDGQLWLEGADLRRRRWVLLNTPERTWEGPLNFLRPSSGASYWHLAGRVVMIEWAHNPERITADFLARLLGQLRSPAHTVH